MLTSSKIKAPEIKASNKKKTIIYHSTVSIDQLIAEINEPDDKTNDRTTTGFVIEALESKTSSETIIKGVSSTIQKILEDSAISNDLHWQIVIRYLQDNIEPTQSEEDSNDFKLKLGQTFGSSLSLLDEIIVIFQEDQFIPNPTNPTDHVPHSMRRILDNVINCPTIGVPQYQENFLSFIKNHKKGELAEILNRVVIKGLTELILTQDTNQTYHTLLHAIEMYEDTARMMRKIINAHAERDRDTLWAQLNDDDIATLCLFTSALAAFHDIVQNEGQYKNEYDSAQAFWKIFREEFANDYPDKAIPEEVKKVAEAVIIEGTLLNMAFNPPCHTALFVTQTKIFRLVRKDTDFDSARAIIDSITIALSSSDVHRAGNLITHSYEFLTGKGMSHLGKIPVELEDALSETFENGLVADYGFSKDQARRLIERMLQGLLILMGQNIRMMADGPFRKFQEETQFKKLRALFDAARIVGCGAEYKDYLKTVSVFTRSEETVSKGDLRSSVSPCGGALISDNLLREAAFSQGMDSCEIIGVYEQNEVKIESGILRDLLFLPNSNSLPHDFKDKIHDVWSVHSELFLPILFKALNDKSKIFTELRDNLMAGIIFVAANQHGLSILAQKPTLLASLYKNVYNIDLNTDLSFQQARVAASAFMSLSQDPKMKLALTAKEPNRAVIKEQAEERLKGFATQTQTEFSSLMFSSQRQEACCVIL